MEVVDTGSLAVQHVWAPVDAVDIYRVGMLVGWQGGTFDGVVNVAAGADPDAGDHICGIITAVDTLEPAFVNDTTANGNLATGVITAADQVARKLAPITDKGPIIYGDKAVHVKIALITPWTKVLIPIFNAAYGVAPTLLTNTVADATGISGTVTNACDFTPVADQCALYWRTGLSKGIMRNTDDTDATTPTNDQAFTYGTAVGDTCVRVPYRTFGMSEVVLDAESLYADCSSTGASSNFKFGVLELNLDVAGNEHMIGFFASRHFNVLT
jgi:hypothetical protein